MPLMRRLNPRRADEAGAVAVLYAILMLVLLGTAAVAIDTGQVYAKRASLQSAVDQAVLAAAAELDGTNTCTPTAIAAAKNYLVANWIDQGGDPKAIGNIDLTSNNVDASGRGDGYIVCTKWQVQLWAPTAKVNLGLARAVTSKTKVEVPAYAAAEVRSPRLAATMPFYATPACSTGMQVLSTDSHGHTTPPVIPLTPSSATTNNSNLTNLSVRSTPVGTAVPSLVITGTNFRTPSLVTQVGFTTASGDHFFVNVTAAMINAGGTSITVAVPASVINLPDLWYVRVLKGGLWSTNDGNSTTGVEPFTVGDERLYCMDSTTGNFGSLGIDRTPSISNPNTLLSVNVADGIDHSLATMPGAPSAPNLCNGVSGAVQAPVNGQNCVPTDTGLPANALEEGMITGIGSYKGRLDKPATPPCSRPNRSVSGYSLNDDVLSCFFTDPSIRVGDVTKSTYTGAPVISPAIFNSPRFVWVPLITDPPNGKKDVSIQGFRPGFITDQPASGTLNAPGATVGVPNGLTLSGTKVREMDIWFIHPNALPPPRAQPARKRTTEAPARRSSSSSTESSTRAPTLDPRISTATSHQTHQKLQPSPSSSEGTHSWLAAPRCSSPPYSSPPSEPQ